MAILQQLVYHNRQKVVSRSNAFAWETTQQTVSNKANKLCTEANKSKKPYNRTKTKIELSLFCNISDKKSFINFNII